MGRCWVGLEISAGNQKVKMGVGLINWYFIYICEIVKE